jgi:hypothetical protein
MYCTSYHSELVIQEGVLTQVEGSVCTGREILLRTSAKSGALEGLKALFRLHI